MKKVTPNGSLIKELRTRLEKGSLQKEMAPAIQVSERVLRDVENKNAAIPIATLDRIAAYLGVPREYIAYAIDAPKLVPPAATAVERVMGELGRDKIIPRFDKDIAYATMDEGKLIHDSRYSHDLTVKIDVSLNDETGAYVEELIRLLEQLTWSKRDWLAQPSPADDIALGRRVRQLLVLLKGNDIWVYYTHHMRHLPERFDLPPEGAPSETKFRVAIAFCPPGEYGEELMYIDVDNGRPYFLKVWNRRNQEGE